MVEWWDAMTTIEQVFATIGIASTILLVIQIILMAVGMAQGGGADSGGADSSADASSGDASMDMDTGTPDVHIDVDSATGVDVDVGGDVDVSAGMDMHTGDIYYHADTVPDYMHADASQGMVSAPDGLHLFTLQGVVAFFAIFGWSGVVMLKADMAPALCIFLAFVFGFATMIVMALIMRTMVRLQADGSMDIRNALGKSGTVYLPIYPNRSKAGKVTLMMQDSLVELPAVTDGDEKLPTGSEVTVIGVSNGNTLIVQKK